MENIDLKSIGGLMMAVMFVSALLKHAWKSFPNEAIPVVNVVLGVPAYIVLLNGNDWSLANIITGLLTVAAAIGLHSGIKHTGELVGVVDDKKAPLIIATVSLFLTGCKFTVMLLACLFLVGCTTLGPDGTTVYDPIKTEKVRAVMKPLITEATGRVIDGNPDVRGYFTAAAVVTCEMRDAKAFVLVNFRARLMGILDASDVRVDPLVRTSFNTIIAIFELNYADRLKADLPEDEFVWNLLDVLCDGIRGGVAGPPPAS